MIYETLKFMGGEGEGEGADPDPLPFKNYGVHTIKPHLPLIVGNNIMYLRILFFL
jgi:hypothetical protein